MADIAFIHRGEPDGQGGELPAMDIVEQGTGKRLGHVVCQDETTCHHLALHYVMGLHLRGKHWWPESESPQDTLLGQGGGGGSSAGSPVNSSPEAAR